MSGLTKRDVHSLPVAQFAEWLGHAASSGVQEPHACALATACGKSGRPSARWVLLKSFDERGFVFTTNYDSRKARELAGNPGAALVFYWPSLHRQIRIEGRVERTSASQSDALYRARPRGARLGTWASSQSRVIPDRRVLERALEEMAAKYPGEIPRPPHWGGYRLEPDGFEFWQQGECRLHDRLRYSLEPDERWKIERLSP